MCVEDLMCQIWCIFHVLFPEEFYLVEIINKQTLYIYKAEKKQNQDVKKNHVVTFVLWSGIKYLTFKQDWKVLFGIDEYFF